ncbi:MAG: hypothetical protein PHW10_04485 [Candidatus Peribacteraceae bacterium]|nr:hypothetical protein [Candidatus Peribacteraceae bacterium]
MTSGDLALLTQPAFPSISVYLPRHRTGAEVHGDRLRLKNALAYVEEELAAQGVSPRERSDLLARPRSLLHDELFWRPAQGLAMFLSPALFRAYRLPEDFDELVVVRDRFHLSPLIPLLQARREFFILAVSKRKVRFLRASESGVHGEIIETFPGGTLEALGDERQEPQIQSHSLPGGGALFHGQGALKEYEKIRLTEYLRLIASHIRPTLVAEPLPLVFAGADPLFGHFREIADFPGLLPQAVRGNPDTLHDAELHRQAWALLAPSLREAEEQALARYSALQSVARASDRSADIERSAYEGKVDTLFLSSAYAHPGSFDPVSRSIELFEGLEGEETDRVNAVAVQTILHDGRLCMVSRERMPTTAPMAAIFRY